MGELQNDGQIAIAGNLWQSGWRRLKRDRTGWISLWIVLAFILLAIASGFNWIGGNWNTAIAKPYAPPTWFVFLAPDRVELTAEDIAKANHRAGNSDNPFQTKDTQGIEDPLAKEMTAAYQEVSKYRHQHDELADTLAWGADQQGRSVVEKIIVGTATSLLVGCLGAFFAVVIGGVLGALAGYFGRKTDDLLMWFYNVFTSVPDMLLLLAFAAVAGRGLTTIIMVMSLTTWTGIFRLMRAEFIKNRQAEYVRAADAIGASHARRIFVHILPNTLHVLLIQFSLLIVGLIKYEVILSFLGFGVSVAQVSLGTVLAEVPNELMQGYWWQLSAVVMVMSVLITAFSLLIDALRDALDPRLR